MKNLQSMVSPFLQNSSASFSLTAPPLLAIIIAHATAIAAATNGNEKPDMTEKHTLAPPSRTCSLLTAAKVPAGCPKLNRGATQNLRREGGLWLYRYMLEGTLHNIHPNTQRLHVTCDGACSKLAELRWSERRARARSGA